MIVNGKRALAYITKIDDISPLDGYDLSFVRMTKSNVHVKYLLC